MSNKLEPFIGKNVIETLTSGMYDDSRFIYREYVQNAADQIDEAVELGILKKKEQGRIEITIDPTQRMISIFDNATGIKESAVRGFLGDVANSRKDQASRKGFRGIGRLGGLGYCNRLVFETSYRNENVKTVMSMDAVALRKIIANRRDNSDASAVISVITSIKKFSEDPKAHYFKVTLEDVSDNTLLSEVNVFNYLSIVSPAPFDPSFSFSKEIYEFFKEHKVLLDEYNISMNGSTIFKSYKDTLTNESVLTGMNLSEKEVNAQFRESKILFVDFFNVEVEEEGVLGLGWFGVREDVNNVMHQTFNERGIRLRKNNIQIGSEDTLNRFFDVDRTNFRFIGELHVFSSSLIPNARRDYFNENKTRDLLESELKGMFADENWENKYAQKASNIYNRLREIDEYNDAIKDFKVKRKKGEIDSAEKEAYFTTKIDQYLHKASKAIVTLRKIKTAGAEDPKVKRLYQHLVGNRKLDIVDPGDLLKKNIYDPPKFSKLNDQQTKIAREIIKLLYDNLPLEDAEILKKKIVDKYN